VEQAYVERRARDDQWIALICHPELVRRRTASSAPTELICRPFVCPWVTDVDVTHATSPCTVTRITVRVDGTARANSMSAGR
jgi:hypothetical protein